MESQVRIEIKSKDAFWGRAFHVEWEDQFPDRKLIADGPGCYRVETEWLEDLELVAAQTFCHVTRAPDNPRRRAWMQLFIVRK